MSWTSLCFRNIFKHNLIGCQRGRGPAVSLRRPASLQSFLWRASSRVSAALFLHTMCFEAVTFQSSTKCRLLKTHRAAPPKEKPPSAEPAAAAAAAPDVAGEASNSKAPTWRPWHSYLPFMFINDSTNSPQATAEPTEKHPAQTPPSQTPAPSEHEDKSRPHRIEILQIIQCPYAAQSHSLPKIEGLRVCATRTPVFEENGSSVVQHRPRFTKVETECSVCLEITEAEKRSMSQTKVASTPSISTTT